MAIFAKVRNPDKDFAAMQSTPIVVNDLEYFSDTDRMILDSALKTSYSSSVITLIPSCECGHLNKAHLKGAYCEKCFSYVTDPQDRVESIVWLKTLYNDYKFLNPEVWMLIRFTLSKQIDCLRWLSDKQYNPPKKIPDFLIAISNTFPKFDRNYKYMIDNLEKMLLFISTTTNFRRGLKNERITKVIEVYRRQKNEIYSNYIPLVNKRLIVVEKTSMGIYTDVGISRIIDTVYSYIKTANELDSITPNRLSTIMGRTLSAMSDIYSNYFRNFIGRKKGLARQHNFGSRLHFTFRTVITSIAGPHRYNEVYAPWGIAVTAYRPHILNVLLNKFGMRYKEASYLLVYAVNNYVDVIDKAINIILDEAKERNGIGLPVIMQRNPSLYQGSAVLVYISKFKTNPRDRTTSISNIVVKSLNADFDGDSELRLRWGVDILAVNRLIMSINVFDYD